MITEKDIEDLESWWGDANEDQDNVLSIVNENLKHLSAKSIELGEPIPPVLQVMAIQYPIPTSMDFINKYRKWFDDLKE